MKKFAIILLIFTAFVQAKAVDYGALEVKVRTHPDEYRELLERFINADTTLTPRQMEEVYYGFPFTPSYEPTDSFPELHEAYEAKDFGRVAALAEEALQLNPVSLDLIRIARSAYEMGAGKTPGAKALNMAIRYEMLVNAILESGGGTDAASPFYVIADSDRKVMLFNIIGAGSVIDKTGVGETVRAYKFIFPQMPRMHILYFDETPELRFKK